MRWVVDTSFWAAVVGESFPNDDGSNRQAIIRRCEVGEPVRLIREPNNNHDSNAIRSADKTGSRSAT